MLTIQLRRSLVKKMIGFRIDEEKWEGFHRLVSGSGDTVQSVMANFVEACIETSSVEVGPIAVGKSGRLFSYELRLRNTMQLLQTRIEDRDRIPTEYRFSDLVDNVSHIHDTALLEEARSVADNYLKWIKKRQKSPRGEP